MPKIHILSDQLANRIAAGEVIERPASVVKELIENSLDARADRIEVEIEGGGTRLIRVTDNGEGMDEDDALLCFERHGTSKLDESHDLIAITSLGFRGEAIPSISSVAKVVLTTRSKQQQMGTQVNFDYGRLSKVHDMGCAVGTVFEIKNLFGRTPARKKFLRTQRTEISHIEEVIKSYALGCPDIGFFLTVDGRPTLRFDAGLDLVTRLRNIIRYKGEFIEIGEKHSTGNRSLHGLLVPPDVQISSSARLRLFINSRAIRDRLMNHAIHEGMRGFLFKGHNLTGYVHLQVAPDEIDVNVHPAKHEVRFRHSSNIHQYIKSYVTQGMQDYQLSIRKSLFGHTPSSEGKPSVSLEKTAQEVLQDTILHTHQVPIQEDSAASSQLLPKSETKARPQDPEIAFRPQESTLQPPRPTPLPLQTREIQKEQLVRHVPEDESRTIDLDGLRVIGQFSNLYIFCQAGDTLFVIDQHAAHERLIFEKLRHQYLAGRVVAQTLMFPLTVELSAMQVQLVEDNHEEIARMGFTVESFGHSTYIIKAIPALGGTTDVIELFMEALDSFGREQSSRHTHNTIDTLLATMACKAAVKSGDELSPQEIEALLLAMKKADLFSHCPHGRPVVRSFQPNEIKKWFLRT